MKRRKPLYLLAAVLLAVVVGIHQTWESNSSAQPIAAAGYEQAI